MQKDGVGSDDRLKKLDRFLAWFYRLLPLAALGVIALLAVWLTVRFAVLNQYGWSLTALGLLVFSLLVLAFMRIGEASKVELAVGAIGRILVEYQVRTEVEASLEAKLGELSKQTSSQEVRKALEAFKPALVRETAEAVTKSLDSYWATFQRAVQTPALTSGSSAGVVGAIADTVYQAAIRRRMPSFRVGLGESGAQYLGTDSTGPIVTEDESTTDPSSKHALGSDNPPKRLA